jgi:hypothetical protein
VTRAKTHDISSDEQLNRWVSGESLHRSVRGFEDGECCPDFSCCKPELKQPEEIRRAFARAGDDDRHKFLGMFLSAAIQHAFPQDADKVRVVGTNTTEN